MSWIHREATAPATLQFRGDDPRFRSAPTQWPRRTAVDQADGLVQQDHVAMACGDDRGGFALGFRHGRRSGSRRGRRVQTWSGSGGARSMAGRELPCPRARTWDPPHVRAHAMCLHEGQLARARARAGSDGRQSRRVRSVRRASRRREPRRGRRLRLASDRASHPRRRRHRGRRRSQAVRRADLWADAPLRHLGEARFSRRDHARARS